MFFQERKETEEQDAFGIIEERTFGMGAISEDGLLEFMDKIILEEVFSIVEVESFLGEEFEVSGLAKGVDLLEYVFRRGFLVSEDEFFKIEHVRELLYWMISRHFGGSLNDSIEYNEQVF